MCVYIYIYVKCQNRCKLCTKCVYCASNRKNHDAMTTGFNPLLGSTAFIYATDIGVNVGTLHRNILSIRSRKKINLKNRVFRTKCKIVLRHQ